MVDKGSPDIGNSHGEDQYRSDDKCKSVYPRSFYDEDSTHSVTNKIFDRIGLAFEIERLKYK